MASINYTREWQRIINQLQITYVRLQALLAAAETSEERDDFKTRLANVDAQIQNARDWITKHKTQESRQV
jgi:hypothetical protein